LRIDRAVLHSTGFNGSAFIHEVAAGRPSNFTGGRSWNITSHFQRSDGFDACSQCFAGTGRANANVVKPA
jgi:hypothetical protein